MRDYNIHIRGTTTNHRSLANSLQDLSLCIDRCGRVQIKYIQIWVQINWAYVHRGIYRHIQIWAYTDQYKHLLIKVISVYTVLCDLLFFLLRKMSSFQVNKNTFLTLDTAFIYTKTCFCNFLVVDTQSSSFCSTTIKCYLCIG